MKRCLFTLMRKSLGKDAAKKRLMKEIHSTMTNR
jgi:hypothetical protein